MPMRQDRSSEAHHEFALSGPMRDRDRLQSLMLAAGSAESGSASRPTYRKLGHCVTPVGGPPNAIGNRHGLASPTTRSSGYASPLPTWQSATGWSRPVGRARACPTASSTNPHPI